MINSKSIRAKLKNIADNNNIDFQSCITRFLHERIIYRISISEYRDCFILKGGNLIYYLFKMNARPTIDVDLLCKGVENNSIELVDVFKRILSIKVDDAVWFNKDNISTEIIAERNKYNGIRLILSGGFDTIKQNIHIDIGFGDSITPQPVNISFPVLLETMQIPDLLAYNAETVIAEKFQTMIFLADFNSRMKDFFDVYTLLESGQYDKEVLKDAVIATFRNRNTHYAENHILFSDEFANNQNRNKIWKAFLKKINYKGVLQFRDVIDKICTELKPVWDNL